MKQMKHKTLAALLAASLGWIASNANAVLIQYDILWTGSSGTIVNGIFAYDDSSAADGFVRDRDGDLISLMLSTTGYGGLSWTWSGDATDPFNFNFVVATETFPVNGAEGSTEAQNWNGLGGSGFGLGFSGSDSRSGLVVDGLVVERTSSLSVTRRPTEVPEPSTLMLLGAGLLGLGVMRRQKVRIL